MGPSFRPEKDKVACEWWLTPTLEFQRQIPPRWSQVGGRCSVETGEGEGRNVWVQDGPAWAKERGSVGSSQPKRAAWRGTETSAKRGSSFRGEPLGEEGITDGHKEQRSITTGPGNCRSKELNKKSLKNPKSPYKKRIYCNHLPAPSRNFQLSLIPGSTKW